MWIPDLPTAARAVLAPFPFRIEPLAGGWTVRGCLPQVVHALLVQAMGSQWASLMRIHQGQCSCGTKTAVVPGAAPSQWARALANSPFGAASVVTEWPYLGATVAGCSLAEPPPSSLAGPGPDRVEAVRRGTWARADPVADQRIGAVVATTGSPGQRAYLWNAYVLGLIPYRASICLPSEETGRQWLQRLGSCSRRRDGARPGYPQPSAPCGGYGKPPGARSLPPLRPALKGGPGIPAGGRNHAAMSWA